MPDSDDILAALDELVIVGRENVVAWMGLMERAEMIRDSRRNGLRYRDMDIPEGLSIIGAVSGNQERLTAAAAKFRRATARQMVDEGLSAADVARMWGVSRQRIASLLAETD